MNNIPKHWQVKKLGEVFDIYRGGSPRPIKDFLTDDKDGINWIKIGDVDNGSKYITKTKQKIIKSGLQKSREVNIGDLLLTNSMSYGRPYISKIKGAIHDGWLVFYPKIDICKDYVFYFFTSFKTYENLSSLAAGSTVKNLQIKFIENLEIPLPPLDEQNRIVEKIQDCFDKIDFVILKLEKSKELIKTYKQSVLSNAFNGKLIKSNLKHWQIKKLGEICDIFDNKRKPINSQEREHRLKLSNKKFPYYGATGKVGYIDDYIFDFEAILLGEDGAPFLDPFKEKAYIVSGKYWVNNHAHILVSKKEFTINFFIYYFLNTVDYKVYVSGTTRLKLNQSSMKQIKIPLPPLDEQNKIVLEIEKRFKVADSALSLIEENLQKAKVLKQSILQEAFNGELIKDKND